MKAMILAGGEGTRLRPLTYTLPKPLVYVNNLPSIEYVVKFLYHYGIREFAINVSYKAELVEEYAEDVFKKKFKDASLFVLKEDKLSGTAGPVKKIQDFFENQNFIVIGCDDIFDFDLDVLISKHISSGAVATIGLFKVDDPSEFGVALVDENNNILAFQEKPKTNPISYLANTGVYVFSPEIFDYILSDEYYDFGTQVFANLLNSGAKFLGVDVSKNPKFLDKSYWIDIGNITNYFRANRELANFRHPFIESKIVQKDNTLIVLDSGVRIGDNTVFEGIVVLGRNSVVSGYIRDSIIWPETRFENSYIVDSVVVGGVGEVSRSVTEDSYTEESPGSKLKGAGEIPDADGKCHRNQTMWEIPHTGETVG